MFTHDEIINKQKDKIAMLEKENKEFHEKLVCPEVLKEFYALGRNIRATKNNMADRWVRPCNGGWVPCLGIFEPHQTNGRKSIKDDQEKQEELQERYPECFRKSF